MSTILADTSRTLRAFLQPRLIAFLTGTRIISFNSPVEMQEATQQGLSLWLYWIERDTERHNLPPERIAPNQIRPVPMPLRLHYLVTPLLQGNQSAETEQEMLGRVLQSFHDTPVLEGAVLQGSLAGTEARLHVRFEPFTLEETARLRDILRLDRPYELGISYEVGVVFVDSALPDQTIPPVQVALPQVGIIVSE